VKNGLNLVPVIAVDYSLANLTFDESCYCLHSLKLGQPNNYLDALKRVLRSYQKFSDYMLAYGFGARTVAGEGPSCNAFSMTGDFMDPFIENEDQLINSY
jgi:Copine